MLLVLPPVLLAPAPPAAAAPLALDLPEALARAGGENPQILAAQARVEFLGQTRDSKETAGYMGLVTKNAILLVDHALHLEREEGLPRRSTLLTLLVVPVFFEIIEGLTLARGWAWLRRKLGRPDLAALPIPVEEAPDA